MATLAHEGVLLNTVGVDGKPNTMTIGWMTAGIIWGKPIVTVLIRPSRHSFGKAAGVLSNNSPSYCGGAMA